MLSPDGFFEFDEHNNLVPGNPNYQIGDGIDGSDVLMPLEEGLDIAVIIIIEEALDAAWEASHPAAKPATVPADELGWQPSRGLAAPVAETVSSSNPSRRTRALVGVGLGALAAVVVGLDSGGVPRNNDHAVITAGPDIGAPKSAWSSGGLDSLLPTTPPPNLPTLTPEASLSTQHPTPNATPKVKPKPQLSQPPSKHRALQRQTRPAPTPQAKLSPRPKPPVVKQPLVRPIPTATKAPVLRPTATKAPAPTPTVEPKPTTTGPVTYDQIKAITNRMTPLTTIDSRSKFAVENTRALVDSMARNAPPPAANRTLAANRARIASLVFNFPKALKTTDTLGRPRNSFQAAAAPCLAGTMLVDSAFMRDYRLSDTDRRIWSVVLAAVYDTYLTPAEKTKELADIKRLGCVAVGR